jgi:hypothetical protein
MCTSHAFINLCLFHLTILFKIQFTCVINLFIICVFLYTLFMSVVTLVHLKIAVGSCENMLVTEYGIVKTLRK